VKTIRESLRKCKKRIKKTGKEKRGREKKRGIEIRSVPSGDQRLEAWVHSPKQEEGGLSLGRKWGGTMPKLVSKKGAGFDPNRVVDARE